MRTPLDRSPWLLRSFLCVWLFVVIAPLVVLLVYSFFDSSNFMMIYKPSLKTWESIFTSGRFEVTVRTLRIALTVTLIELVLAFPSALWLAKLGRPGRSLSQAPHRSGRARLTHPAPRTMDLLRDVLPCVEQAAGSASGAC
jgi:ABC-type spermidine/putrescine transport system permease subunit II